MTPLSYNIVREWNDPIYVNQAIVKMIVHLDAVVLGSFWVICFLFGFLYYLYENANWLSSIIVVSNTGISFSQSFMTKTVKNENLSSFFTKKASCPTACGSV